MGTTQAMALRALPLATQLSASDVHGSLQIVLDRKQVETLNLTAENNDLLHYFLFKRIDPHYLASISYTSTVPEPRQSDRPPLFHPVGQQAAAADPLSISIAYDRTKLTQNDIATETVSIRNDLAKTGNMVMVDLGIPPGFDMLGEDLQSIQENTAGSHAGRLEKCSLIATRANPLLAPHQEVAVKIRLRAKYPIRAYTLQSRVYEYYDSDVNSIAQPVRLEVDGH